MEFLETFAGWLATGHPLVKMIFAGSPLVALFAVLIAYRKDQDWKNARDMLKAERQEWRADLREFRGAMEASTNQITHLALILEHIRGKIQ